ncbi:MAG: hypothetical protein JNK30_19870 [Phenylobacterium sp.]|uniref:hypothetical protein n=1 Tax=Phenylobacterium sp. TaxID=1871053 RepID=UPI001A5BAAB7|nr:hypothetical protein [Phenylobacterium sp.]MBL8773654.1 hypothetical protein [Phenylobacterium sp.]
MSTVLDRRAALGLSLVGLATAVAAPAQAVGAMKHYILVDLKPGVDQLVLDRWYMTFHAPEVRRAFKAWQRNYVSFRSYLPPEEARAAYRLLYGRMTEIHFDSLADFQESRPNNIYSGQGLGAFTPPPGGWAAAPFTSTTASLPVNPQHMHLNTNTPPKQTPYLRWIVFFRYPDGVTAEQGDAWYRGSYAPEAAKRPGLKRYATYEAVSRAAEYPRVAELWFDDYAAWKAAFLPRPQLPAPPWGGRGLFADGLSMFIGENPDVDFVNDRRAIP